MFLAHGFAAHLDAMGIMSNDRSADSYSWQE